MQALVRKKSWFKYISIKVDYKTSSTRYKMVNSRERCNNSIFIFT